MIKSVADIAKQFGVLLNEEFEVDSSEYKDNKYRFSGNNLEYYRVLADEWTPSEILGKLLSGEIKIIKKPFKPKVGDTYYYPCSSGRCMDRAVWHGTISDYAMFKAGWVFRSYDECEAKLDEIRKEIREYND